ncbi:MAG: transglycosylase SLT domain-containing protein [Rhizomicrobium sp.]
MLAEAANATSNRSDVIAAIRQASAATGSDFNYLLDTAMRESSLKPQAKSETSSASGLYQFVGQTWLGMVKQHGAKYGLASDAAAITQDSNGRYRVDNAADRQAILALRNDPKVAALMEGEYANQSKAALESTLGRDVCGGELYAAHFLGPGAACKLIQMNASAPSASAAAAFPAAADANRSVFYHADGSAKSVREVYQWALKQPSGAQTLPKSPAAAPAKSYAGNVPYSGDWLASQMYDATEPANGSFGTISLSPVSLTPGVIQILSSLTGPDTQDKKN